VEADLSGQKIGEYEVVAPIGRGGMGMVYEGRQPLIGKRVAIKVLLKAFSGQKEVVDRFLAEARAVNAIRHRGIVDIFSFGQLGGEGGLHYCVMEFLEGLAFDELIRTRAPFTPGDALRWTDEVLDALDAAHKAGVIHRDIKPSNLFLVDTGHGRPYVKLLDFGIAKLSTFKGGAQVGEASAVVGTPDYMAPEQARAKTISGATDLYAVGCVLFELLTRERLFEGLSPVDMMFAHVRQAPRAPSAVVPGISRGVDQFVLSLLAKDPEARPKSAVAAREELHLLLRQLNEAPTLPPPSAWTLREPALERAPPASGPATPRPGWNEDDGGSAQTWMTPGGGKPVSGVHPDAATQLATPRVPDSGQLQPVTASPSLLEAAGLKKRKTGPVVAAVAAVLLLGGVGFLLAREAPPARPPPEPTPAVAKVDPPQPVVAPTVVAPPEVADAGAAAVAAEEAADAGAPAPVAAAVTAVKKSGPTAAALAERLKRLKGRLTRYESRRGQADILLGAMAAETEKKVLPAKSPGELKAASKALDEFQEQLKAVGAN
jgi:eukaryotic-like serine/threonine-protein kinase